MPHPKAADLTTKDRVFMNWPALPLRYGIGQNTVTAHALARSAIFSTQVFRRHADRPHYISKTKLTSISAIEIYQTAGFQLDQGDADVMYELIRRIFSEDRQQESEVRLRFNRRQLLKALGRVPGGKTRAILDESIERLFAASFEFRIPGVITGMSRLLLSVIRRDDDFRQENDYEVLVDSRLAQLFNQNHWTLLKRSERDHLLGDPLAKGLHAYFSTHLTPYPMLPATLKSLMGRDSMQESKWLIALRASLERVKSATGWHTCQLESGGNAAGKVVVHQRAPTAPTQGSSYVRPTRPPMLPQNSYDNAWGDI